VTAGLNQANSNLELWKNYAGRLKGEKGVAENGKAALNDQLMDIQAQRDKF